LPRQIEEHITCWLKRNVIRRRRFETVHCLTWYSDRRENTFKKQTTLEHKSTKQTRNEPNSWNAFSTILPVKVFFCVKIILVQLPKVEYHSSFCAVRHVGKNHSENVRPV